MEAGLVSGVTEIHVKFAEKFDTWYNAIAWVHSMPNDEGAVYTPRTRHCAANV